MTAVGWTSVLAQPRGEPGDLLLQPSGLLGQRFALVGSFPHPLVENAPELLKHVPEDLRRDESLDGVADCGIRTDGALLPLLQTDDPRWCRYPQVYKFPALLLKRRSTALQSS